MVDNFESKVLSKQNFKNFIETINVAKDFNDSITFNDGIAYLYSSDKTMLMKIECNCPINIELTKLANKINILNAYCGDVVELNKDDHYYIINNGSDIIKLPFTENPFKATEEVYNSKLNTLIVKQPFIFDWNITSEKFESIRKYFSGFGSNSFIFKKEANDPNLMIKIGAENIFGCAIVNNVKIEDEYLIPIEINTDCEFEYISSTGKSFNKINISAYYNIETGNIVFVSDLESNFCKIQAFRRRPAVSTVASGRI